LTERCGAAIFTDVTTTLQVRIFHLKRGDQTPIFLHPFHGKDALGLLEKSDITGVYGEEPRVEALTMFRNELYRIVEDEVKNWIADTKFIPRFLISAGVFLVAYFVLSYAVRDPVPVLDELSLSIAGAIVVYVALGKRYQQSDAAMKKRMRIRGKVDRIVFQESRLVTRLEDVLHAYEKLDARSAIEHFTGSALKPLGEEDREEAAEVLGYLTTMFSSKDHRRHEKRLRRNASVRAGELSDTERWAESGKIDFPFFLLFLEIKWSLMD